MDKKKTVGIKTGQNMDDKIKQVDTTMGRIWIDKTKSVDISIGQNIDGQDKISGYQDMS